MKKLFKKMSMRSLRGKLILSFTIVLLIPSLLIGIFSYNTAKNELENQLLKEANENVKELEYFLNNKIGAKIEQVSYLSDKYAETNSSDDKRNAIIASLDEYLSLNNDVENVYIGTKDGKMLSPTKFTYASDYDPRQRPWYLEATSVEGRVIVTEPYESKSTGEMVVTVAQMVKDGSGVVGVDVNLEGLVELAKQGKIGQHGYAFLLDRNKKYIAHPDEKAGSVAKSSFVKKLYSKDKGTFTYTYSNKKKKMFFTTNDLTGWKIAGTMSLNEVQTAAKPIWIRMSIVLIISLLLGYTLVYFVIRSITKPIKQLMNRANQIGEGDLTTLIEVKKEDEIGQLTIAFNQMIETLKSIIKQASSNADIVASSSEELLASTDQTSKATEQVTAAIQQIAGGAEAQTTRVLNTAQSLEEITQGMDRIASSSVSVVDLSNSTNIEAEEGRKLVENTVNQMSSISESVQMSDQMIQKLHERSNEIGMILEVITGIADQTNLLALNAAIEAARAGEHGKGFAVVADEVRKLAEQSQQAAKQIAHLIKETQQDAEKSVQVMKTVTNDVETGITISNNTKDSFERILLMMKEIAPQMEEVSAAVEQVSASLQEVSSSTTELAKVAEENSATSEEVAASSEETLASMEEIEASSNHLAKTAEELRALVDIFKI